MSTLTIPTEQDSAARHQATELDPLTLRTLTLFAIARGATPDELRTRSAGAPYEADDRQVANEMDRLAARGLTKRHAVRAWAERDRQASAFLAELRVAQAALDEIGPAAVRRFRDVADEAGREGDHVTRRSFLNFATLAELQLAEDDA